MVYFRRMQGDYSLAISDSTATILDNTNSVGNHVCTYICKTTHGKTIRAKLYNKVVSNFEAGEVLETFGGHLADYVDCSNKRLRRTFLHPKVQENGCTRIEVSLYACSSGKDISVETGREVVQDVLDAVEDSGAFVLQPPKQQWRCLAKHIDRCLVVADRPTGSIYTAWYAHSTTGRIAGVRSEPTKETIENDIRWEKAVQWMASNFGFRRCPIFRIDILDADEEKIYFGPLRCYTKDAPTILSRCNRPTQKNTGPDPKQFLPETNTICWQWRDRKPSHAIGVEKIEWPIDEIDTDRCISTLSTKARRRKLLEIQDAAEAAKWQEQKQKELEKVDEYYKQKKELENRIVEDRNAVRAYIDLQPKRIANLPTNTRLEILGGKWIYTKYGRSARVVAYVDGHAEIFLATKQLYEKMQERKHTFAIEGDIFYTQSAMHVVVGGKKEYCSSIYRPIDIAENPTMEKNRKAAEILELPCTLEKLDVPKNTTKTIDFPQGEYECYKYADTVFRGKRKTYLFLGKKDSEEVVPVHGYFLQEEIEKIDIEKVRPPLLCRLSIDKTTKNNCKDRIATLYTTENGIQELEVDLFANIPPIPAKTPTKKCKTTDVEEGIYYCYSFQRISGRVYLHTDKILLSGYWIQKYIESLESLPFAPIACKLGPLCTSPSAKGDRKTEILAPKNGKRRLVEIHENMQKVDNPRKMLYGQGSFHLVGHKHDKAVFAEGWMQKTKEMQELLEDIDFDRIGDSYFLRQALPLDILGPVFVEEEKWYRKVYPIVCNGKRYGGFGENVLCNNLVSSQCSTVSGQCIVWRRTIEDRNRTTEIVVQQNENMYRIVLDTDVCFDTLYGQQMYSEKIVGRNAYSHTWVYTCCYPKIFLEWRERKYCVLWHKPRLGTLRAEEKI